MQNEESPNGPPIASSQGRIAAALRLACIALLALPGLLVAGHCFAGRGLAAEDDFHTYGPISVHSDGYGELSTVIYTINVTTTGTLMVNYAAPRAHCSSLRMHFLLDGREKAVSGEIAPGHRTEFVDLGPVSPGGHIVGLQAEGIPGGCNTGKILAWEGSADVWTTLSPGQAEPSPGEAVPASGKDLGDVFFDINVVSHTGNFGSRGTVVTADGFMFGYEVAGGSTRALTPNARGYYSESDLLERFSHSRTLVGHVRTGGFEQIKRLALNLGKDGDPKNLPRTLGTDRGETTYRAFRRRASSGEYDAQLIGESGNREWTNQSVEGIALKGWLIETLQPNGHESAPQDIVCVTYPCP